MMLRRQVLSVGVVLLGQLQAPSAPPQQDLTYRLKLAVDEVSLTFTATDDQGHGIDDLKAQELRIIDNGVPATKIVALESTRDEPIRVGFLIDSSNSMAENFEQTRRLAVAAAGELFKQPGTRGFVMDFGSLSLIAKDWTDDAAALQAGIRSRRVAGSASSSRGGTALLDSIYRACLNQFGHEDFSTSRNVVLVFSDGLDNASQGDMRLAVDQCQKTNATIYAFRFEPQAAFSSGPTLLADLAGQTGGRVFPANAEEAEINRDLRLIDSDLRNRYRVVFKPSYIRHDGIFHKVDVSTSRALVTIRGLLGYYAPVR